MLGQQFPGIKYPSGDREMVTMTSPDSTGAVAYYVETMERDEHVLDTDVMRASCQYLQAYCLKRDLEIVRGPYIVLSVDDPAVPPGWRLSKAVVWVDEFDCVVPQETQCTIIVNGRQIISEKRVFSYYDIVSLAGYSLDVYPTVMYSKAESRPSVGTLTAVDRYIRARAEGTIFNVATTNRT